MPLHIKDEGASAAVRRLARIRKLTLTNAVRTACEEALARDDRARTGKKADKAFFDREWGDDA
jgi:hypothetical protein